MTNGQKNQNFLNFNPEQPNLKPKKYEDLPPLTFFTENSELETKLYFSTYNPLSANLANNKQAKKDLEKNSPPQIQRWNQNRP